DVDYNYAGKQSIPATGLPPVRYAALWAASERSEAIFQKSLLSGIASAKTPRNDGLPRKYVGKQSFLLDQTGNEGIQHQIIGTFLYLQ
ncbi:MAG: hypothetical protein K9J81_12395, partial [Desulfohalobiaceae bacterium]|nr:hypothetical protein [Desulfohalobiaceae bacterium]